MQTDCDFANPQRVLEAFWAAMNRWEVDAWATKPSLDDPDALMLWFSRIANERHQILEVFCVMKKGAAIEPADCGSPPTYDPAKEHVVDLVQHSPARTDIKSEGSTLSGRDYVYTLTLNDGRWLLKSKQHVDRQGKTRKTSL